MDETIAIEERAGLGLASVMARKGVSAAELGRALGLDLPGGPRSTRIDGLAFWGTGPASWLAIANRHDPDWPDRLEALAGPLAYISDQSGSYAMFRLSGGHARTLLQRGAAIDLDPQAFPPGSVATTAIAHIGVVICSTDDGLAYDVAVFRSYAGAFRHWLDSVMAAL